MTSTPRMSNAELTAYVAELENENVQQYVAALIEEHSELTNQLNGMVRAGYSDGGRAAVRTIGRILLFVAVMVIAYFAGRSSK